MKVAAPTCDDAGQVPWAKRSRVQREAPCGSPISPGGRSSRTVRRVPSTDGGKPGLLANEKLVVTSGCAPATPEVADVVNDSIVMACAGAAASASVTASASVSIVRLMI